MLELNRLYNMDCIKGMKEIPDNSIDAIVTDPPYNLTSGSSKGFMGKEWDGTGIAFNVELWKEALRVLKPGGHLLSFGGTRTYHRMACAIEDAGFEIRDQIQWIYGSGFPKSYNIAKGIEGKKVNGSASWNDWKKLDGEKEPVSWGYSKEQKEQGYRPSDYTESNRQRVGKVNFTSEQAKQWDGWGTALKPANEPIVLARKPLSEKTIVENVLKWGTGGLNIDGCRVGVEQRTYKGMSAKQPDVGTFRDDNWKPKDIEVTVNGRFPANVIHDGSEEVLELFPETQPTKPHSGDGGKLDTQEMGWGFKRMPCELSDNGGSAARFFYCAKASQKERNAGLENYPEQTKIFNGKSNNSSKDIKDVEQRFTTETKNIHPTVKPLSLMKYLVTLITPPNGIVLDPFSGSGTTLIACKELGFNFIGFELEKEYCDIANARLESFKQQQKLF